MLEIRRERENNNTNDDDDLKPLKFKQERESSQSYTKLTLDDQKYSFSFFVILITLMGLPNYDNMFFFLLGSFFLSFFLQSKPKFIIIDIFSLSLLFSHSKKNMLFEFLEIEFTLVS